MFKDPFKVESTYDFLVPKLILKSATSVQWELQLTLFILSQVLTKPKLHFLGIGLDMRMSQVTLD
jgi:hypothetical protein